MWSLAWPWVLIALPLPLIARKLLSASPSLQDAGLKVPSLGAFLSLSRRPDTDHLLSWRLWLAAIAWILLVVAAARPEHIGAELDVQVSGRNLMLAVDLSGSMDQKDFELANRRVDRLTAIGDAITLAVKRIHDQEVDASEQVLILLTDGANTAGEIEPLKAAQLAQQVGLRIYTIGIGAEQLEVASLIGGRRNVNPSADLDEDTLTSIAELTGGRYFRAKDTAGLQGIYQLVDELEPVEEPEAGFRPVKSLYYWPLGGAFVFAAFLCVVSLLQNLAVRKLSGAQTDAG